MIYRPLGRSGLLVSTVGLGGNNFRTRLDDAASRAVVDAAVDAGSSMVELAIGWLADRPTVGSVIAGASSPAQVAANAGAASVVIDDEVRAAVDRAVLPPG